MVQELELKSNLIEASSSAKRLTANIDVIIPALNEENSIQLVLRDLPDVRNVYVVDNGSTDDTSARAEALGAIVLQEKQRGYGAACLRGLNEIADRHSDIKSQPKIVVFIDADYSDHPEQLTELVSPILNGDADFVLGSRLLGRREAGAMPPQSVYGNKFACFLMWLFFGAKYTDLGPFRAIRFAALKHLQMRDQNFGWTIEMQIKAKLSDLRTHEIPAHYRRRVGASKISGTVMGTIRAGYKILLTVFKYGFFSRPKIGKFDCQDHSIIVNDVDENSNGPKSLKDKAMA